MRIAFHAMGSDLWYGGISHIRSFLYSLRLVNNSSLLLSLLVSPDKKEVPLDLSKEVENVIVLPPTRIISWRLNQMLRKVFTKNKKEEGVLKRHKVSIVFRSLSDYGYTDIPTLSWIPDFQHIHLPEMFTDKERKERDEEFLKTAKVSTRVILMSEAVKKDFQSFAPKYAHKARVIKTASYIPESIYWSDPKLILELYNLPERFIYLPNQFWKHKNHELVFQAVKVLKNRGLKILVVCSGYPGDYRHRAYFAGLFQKLSKLDIRRQVIYLGMIPYEHVLLLMRQSVCVLNPSLFEGFGLTVSESGAIGKRVLLSDIPAHREHTSSKIIFFDPYNYEDLAGKMGEIWQAAPSGPDNEFESQARQDSPKRLRACADSFLSVVREVVR